jgi:hypothetical protein
MTGDAEGLPLRFRVWSISAFALESLAVILAFFFMVFILKWKISVTMLYILLLVMVVSAALLIVTGRAAAGK